MGGSKRVVLLADIDGRRPGSAALVSQPRLTLQPSDARPFIVVFTEGEDGCTGADQ